jgi:hypothetical protein
MTAKYPSPLLGYNNNVRHKGKVFHIQTEDSGVKYGHIITHLFMDGGRILKSVKTSYAEYLGSERMGDIIREMMKQQHKAMFIALRDGKFDPIADGGAEASQMTKALAAESPPSRPPPAAREPEEPTAPPAPRRATPAAVPAAQAAAAISPHVKTLDGEPPATIRQPPQEELSLDIEALERAAAAANVGSPVLRSANDLPPPPANLFRERIATGKYRITPPPPTPAYPAQHKAMPGPVAARRPSQTAMAAVGERRYAPTRPASIFGQARPQQGKTIFGEDLISDKSLDEVILSYLAEDLDTEKK